MDAGNIFEFLLKWQKGKGLDPSDNTAHAEYLEDLGLRMTTVLKDRITGVARMMDSGAGNSVFQETSYQNIYCKKKALATMVKYSC